MTEDPEAELKALRHEVVALREELAETNRGVVALTAELAERTTELEAADQRKGWFLALLAHELRNPLAVIDLVVDDVSPDAHATLLRRQVDHIRHLVDDLLDVSRIERGKVTLDLETLNVGALVQTTIEDLRGVFAPRGHRVEWTPPDEPQWVVGDASRLSQVVANLLDNAVKYSPDRSRIWVELVGDGPLVSLRVRDEGRGLDPDEQARVFEMFEQVDESMGRTRGGLGIGLTLVRSLVELHHGTIHVQSEGRDRGSEFRIQLPSASPPQPSESSAPALDAPTPADLRILLVEDGDELRELLAARLRRRGVDVATATDAFDALEHLAEEADFDAVVTDLGLPQMDGYELAQRALDRHPTLRLVALSGYGSPADRARTAAIGFSAHLVKPVALDDLLDVLIGDAAS